MRQQVRLELGFIEQEVNFPGLMQWWDEFIDDYFAYVQREARHFARLAINTAWDPFLQAENSGRTLAQARRVNDVLEQWLQDIERIVLPPDTSTKTPQPPGASGGGGSGGGTGG